MNACPAFQPRRPLQADSQNSLIRSISLSSGVVSTLAGRAGVSGFADGVGSSARFNRPFRIRLDAAGKTAVIVRAGRRAVEHVGCSSHDIDPFARQCDSFSHTVRYVILATATVTTLAGTAGVSAYADGVGASTAFNYPWGVGVDDAGAIALVADRDNSVIRFIDIRAARVTTLAGAAGLTGFADGLGSAAMFNVPMGVVLSRTGDVAFISDSLNAIFRRIDVSSGLVSTLAGTAGVTGTSDGRGTAALFNQPLGLSIDAGQLAYIVSVENCSTSTCTKPYLLIS